MKKSESLKQYFFVLRQLVSRELKRKYARSYLGILWSVLNPMLSMAVLSMIFSTMFKKSIQNFPIYYLTGLIIWQLFSTATSTSITTLVDNRQLLLKVKLSKETFVLARVFTAVANFGYTFIAYIIMLFVFKIKFNPYMLLLPIDVIFLTLFSIGMAYILCTCYVFFADINHLYSVVLTLWMYMSAIFYPIDSVPVSMQLIIGYNPMFSYINFARDCVLNAKLPDATDFTQIAAWGIVSFAIGTYVFKKNENKVMQVS